MAVALMAVALMAVALMAVTLTPRLAAPPGDLLGDVRQGGGVPVGVHPPRLTTPCGDIEALAGDLTAWMLAIQFVDSWGDLVAHHALVAHRAREFAIARRGPARDPLLLQAYAQLGLAAVFPGARLALGAPAREGAIALARRGGEEVRDARRHPHPGSVSRSLAEDLLLVGAGKPPAIRLPHQRHTAVEPLATADALVGGAQTDRQEERLPLLQRRDPQPVGKRRVLAGRQE